MVKRLLVVEGDAETRSLIRAVAASEQRIEVADEVTTAEAAILLAAKNQPDLIVLDHLLPGTLRGIDAAPDLKIAAPNASILVIGSEALATRAESQRGVDAFLGRRQLVQWFLPTVRRLLGLPVSP